MRRLLVADLFCGAGGTSTGCRRALKRLGLTMKLVCVNHSPEAIETHRRNHPEARHYCEDIDTVRPSTVVPEGRLDLLLASPECIDHSRAKGGKPINDQRRMNAWAIHRWCGELRVRCLIVENVPEFMEWGPINPHTKRPIKSLRGSTFRAWLLALRRMHYKTKHAVLNCADFGDRTTRKRFFLIARNDGGSLDLPTPTHSKNGERGLAPWLGADDVIDFQEEGQSIFWRKKRLARKTLERILAGLERFEWPEPYLVALRAFLAGKPLPEFVARPGEAEPLVTRTDMHKSNALCVRRASEPLATLTTSNGLAVIEPFVLSQASGGAPRATRAPVPTIPTDGAHALITAYHGKGKARSAREPLGTATTRDRFALVTPLTHHDASCRARSVEQPLATLTGAHRGELAFIVGSFGERAGQTPRVKSVQEPVSTICAHGSVRLVQGDRFKIDIKLRMLRARELAGAHSFNDDGDYDFFGNQTQVVQQIGNSVPCRTAAALVAALVGADR